jgi:hypothetical protein
MTQRSYSKQEDLVKALELEAVCVDERAMKARFEEWMKTYEKTYQDEVSKKKRPTRRGGESYDA